MKAVYRGLTNVTKTSAGDERERVSERISMISARERPAAIAPDRSSPRAARMRPGPDRRGIPFVAPTSLRKHVSAIYAAIKVADALSRRSGAIAAVGHSLTMARYKQGLSFRSVVEAMSRIFLALAVALAMLGGCSAPHYGAEQLRADIGAPYQLASGDRLRVIVFGQDGLTNSFSVDGAGNVSMPLIGTVRARGSHHRAAGNERSRPVCGRDICAIPAFRSRSKPSVRSLCSAKSESPDNIRSSTA